MLVRHEAALDRIGGLDERIVAFEEWDTALSLARHYDFGFVAESTFVWDCRRGDTMFEELLAHRAGLRAAVSKAILRHLANGGPSAIAESPNSTIPEFGTSDHEKNRGLPETLNTGFGHAAGPLLTWSSDDNHTSDAIGRMTRLPVRHPGIFFVYTAMHIIDEEGSGMHSSVRGALPTAQLCVQNCGGGCFLYTRDVYREVRDYSAAAILVEDYDYWICGPKRFRMRHLFAPLYDYRHHAASLTSQHGSEKIAVLFDRVRQQIKQNEVA